MYTSYKKLLTLCITCILLYNVLNEIDKYTPFKRENSLNKIL